MNRNVPTTFTNMCMIYSGDRILVLDRKDEKWSGIAFPGGHVEDGESFAQSVIREVYEETGLTIESPVLCGVKEWQNEDRSRYVVLLYKTDKFTGKLISSSEGETYWISKDDIKRCKLAEDFKEMLKIFENDDISELYYYQRQDRWEKRIF